MTPASAARTPVERARVGGELVNTQAHQDQGAGRIARKLAADGDVRLAVAGDRASPRRRGAAGWVDVRDIHLLQVTMRSLRAGIAKVSDRPFIETVYGAGYRMACLHGFDEEQAGGKLCTCGRPAPGSRAS